MRDQCLEVKSETGFTEITLLPKVQIIYISFHALTCIFFKDILS